MAAKHVSFILLLTLLSSLLHMTHARDSQMFNKVPSKTSENVVTQTQLDHQVPNKEQDQPPLDTEDQEQQPNFTPENENNYGLYGGHESSSTNTPNNFPYNAKYLPKNYNPVAYVTEADDFTDDSSFEDKPYTTTTTSAMARHENNNNGYYNGGNNYYNGEQQQRNNYYNNGGNNYNVQREGISDTSFMDRAYTTNTNNNNNNVNNMNMNNMENNNNNNYNNGGRSNRVQPQGMSDTRFLENGRYYYDINAEKYSRDPFENAKEFVARNQYNTRGYNGNNENSYRYNNNNNNNYNYNNYMQGQEQYHDEKYMP